jgi:hypothetical protein
LEANAYYHAPAQVRSCFIPAKRYTWQSDVETVHRLVEDEFIDRERLAT